MLRRLHTSSLPNILNKQLYIIIYGLIVPYLISESLQIFPLMFRSYLVSHNYIVASFSTLLLSVGLLYCARKVMGLRFLNLTQYVYGPPRADFINHFRVNLERLGEAVSTYELQPMVRNFLEEILQIPFEKTTLYLRPIEFPYEIPGVHYHTHPEVEKFLSVGETIIQELMKKERVLIYDEISFSHFYDQTVEHEILLQFLADIKADIFLPLYYKDKLLAYVIVERNARKKLYNSAERDELIMFSHYLSITINILYSRREEVLMNKIKNLENEKVELSKEIEERKQKFNAEKQMMQITFSKEKEGIEQEKREIEQGLLQKKELLKKELYFRHQELNQYRECLQTLLRKSLQTAGALFYKNGRFTIGNKEAEDLLEVNPNTCFGHPLVKKLRKITAQVADFKSPRTIIAKNDKGESLALAAVPYIEEGGVVITISFGSIDLVKQKINFLKDPRKWDYLFYLETTKSGRLINELLPGDSNELLDFKINLLQTAISREATLLDVAHDDLDDIASVIHQISLREELHTLNLKGTIDTAAMATRLFGINPLFEEKNNEQPLLKLLDGRGTLFIKDVHLLDRTCQDYLAEFIRYGVYRAFKSEEWQQSNVRIICSSNQDLQRLVNADRFSSILFEELRKTTLCTPSVSQLSAEELDALSEGFSQQIIAKNVQNNLLHFSEKDRNKLHRLQPVSFRELKSQVKKLVMQKAEKSNLQETIISPAYETRDPLLQHAALLGKLALKDKKIMAMLWEKFDKNQNKIAEFLGVNRSTVHRRCRMYNLK